MNYLGLMREVDAKDRLRKIIEDMREKFGELRSDAVFMFKIIGFFGREKIVKTRMERMLFSEVPRGIIIIDGKKYRLNKVKAIKVKVREADAAPVARPDLLEKHMEMPATAEIRLLCDQNGKITPLLERENILTDDTQKITIGNGTEPDSDHIDPLFLETSDLEISGQYLFPNIGETTRTYIKQITNEIEKGDYSSNCITVGADGKILVTIGG